MFVQRRQHTAPRGLSQRLAHAAERTMGDSAVTVRTKKFITNRLLQRRQFVRTPPGSAVLLSASSGA